MKINLKRFLVGLTYLIFIFSVTAIILGLIVGPAFLADKTGHRAWFWAYTPLVICLIWLTGLAQEES